MRLINADELLTAFPVDDEPTLTKSCVRMTIQRMPTVDAVPVKRGKWIEANTHIYGIYECTACKAWTYIPHEPRDYSFCPKCGADMRGDKNG